VDNLAKADLAPEHFLQRQRVKGQHEPVIFTEFIGENEARRDELNGIALDFGGHSFHNMYPRFQILPLRWKIRDQSPIGCFYIRQVWC
jgi:hypothetical protein